MSLLSLIFVSVLIGYLWGWASCAIHHKRRAEIDATLSKHRQFMREFEEKYPEYRGTQWGKP